MNFWRALGVVHVLIDLILYELKQFNLSHCSINEIKLLIKMCGLLVHSGYQSSHVTKYEGRYNGTSDNYQRFRRTWFWSRGEISLLYRQW